MKPRRTDTHGSFRALYRQIEALHNDLMDFRTKTERRFDSIDRRFDRLDDKLDVMGRKVGGLGRKIDGLAKALPGIIGDAVRKANRSRDKRR